MDDRLKVAVSAMLFDAIFAVGAGWKYGKQLWQFQGAATGLLTGYLLGRSRLL